jgi:hypothetical protein
MIDVGEMVLNVCIGLIDVVSLLHYYQYLLCRLTQIKSGLYVLEEWLITLGSASLVQRRETLNGVAE